jgi:GH15 family glucan-1,4-alpha-glucosidase
MTSRVDHRIEDYALIGDLQTAALVHRDGSIDWLCLPRFDSPACFAALLGDESHGHWRIAPSDAGARRTRRYVGETLVLETEWATESGSVRVLDFMPPRDEVADVVRIVEGVRGTVEVSMELRLRFDHGSVSPWILQGDGGGHYAVAGPDSVWLHSDVEVAHHDRTIATTFTVGEGERVGFVLTYQPSHLGSPRRMDPHRALSGTKRFWEEWVDGCDVSGPYAEEVRRSLILIKALTYAPTGGILAAATTSLPEQIGGERNWDYRYCWLRDASFSLQALLHSGYLDEARAWREWLVRAAAGRPDQLRIMYRVDGGRWIHEQTVDWLPGFAGSRPVRIGNGASEQRQLDVWGEVLVSLHLARDAGLPLSETSWEVQRELMDWLEGNWADPDNGLWEMRGDRQHFVHSKALAWAGVDRSIRTAEKHGLDAPVSRWKAMAQQIHSEVSEKGFDSERGTFVQYYGTKEVDAALLLLPRVGFVSWDDPRAIGTVRAVQADLEQDGFLRRYRNEQGADGLSGGEGVFVACSFWLVDALKATGRDEEATALFEKLLALRNDVGMLSEEYDVAGSRHLGNTPQAFSLVGLVNSARHLADGHVGTHAPGEPR